MAELALDERLEEFFGFGALGGLEGAVTDKTGFGGRGRGSLSTEAEIGPLLGFAGSSSRADCGGLPFLPPVRARPGRPLADRGGPLKELPDSPDLDHLGGVSEDGDLAMRGGINWARKIGGKAESGEKKHTSARPTRSGQGRRFDTGQWSSGNSQTGPSRQEMQHFIWDSKCVCTVGLGSAQRTGIKKRGLPSQSGRGRTGKY